MITGRASECWKNRICQFFLICWIEMNTRTICVGASQMQLKQAQLSILDEQHQEKTKKQLKHEKTSTLISRLMLDHIE